MRDNPWRHIEQTPLAGHLKRALDESGQLDEIKGSLYKLKKSERVVCALTVPLQRPRDKAVIQNLPLTCQDKWQRKKEKRWKAILNPGPVTSVRSLKVMTSVTIKGTLDCFLRLMDWNIYIYFFA